MKRIAAFVALVLLGLCAGFQTTQAQTEIEVVQPPAAAATADAKIYGEYPIAYKEIITRWLGTKLTDPTSAVIEWLEEPKPGEFSPQKGGRHVGYLVDFKVNARNQFGAPTGKQRYRVVLRNGEVLWGGRPPS